MATIADYAAMIQGGSALNDVIAAGASQGDVMAAIRFVAEARNRATQRQLADPPAQLTTDWARRKAWLLDGQAIHGELRDMFWAAITALKADDQAEYSKQRDLLFKALRTFLDDPPPNS